MLGCKGGWPTDAFKYVKEHGLPSWDEYPYIAAEHECKDKSASIVTHISNYHTVSDTSDALKVVIYHRAPTVVVLQSDTNSFKTFQGDGVLDDTRCSAESRHAVVAVGWGPGHFIIKNSWGEEWGKEGYGRVPDDYCGITTEASYPVM